MSFSACSGPLHPDSVTQCARSPQSPATSHTPVLLRGTTPGLPLSLRQAVLAYAPLSLDFSPLRWRNLGREDTHVPSGISAGPVVRVAPKPGGSAGGPPRIAARPPVGWTGISLVPAGTPAAAESPPLVRSLGACADVSGARPLPEGCPSFGESVPPDPLVPSSWFDPHLDGFLRALVSRLLHLVPALTPLRFHPALPPTASGFPETPDVGDATLSRSVVSHPSKNPPPVCLRTRDANLEPAVPRHRGLCPLAVFTTSRRCSGPRGQRVAVCRCQLS